MLEAHFLVILFCMVHLRHKMNTQQWYNWKYLAQWEIVVVWQVLQAEEWYFGQQEAVAEVASIACSPIYKCKLRKKTVHTLAFVSKFHILFIFILYFASCIIEHCWGCTSSWRHIRIITKNKKKCTVLKKLGNFRPFIVIYY